MTDQGISEVWKGKGLSVQLLFSQAGIATQILVKGQDEALLVDAGDGALRDMRDVGFDSSTLKGIIITHGHYDHMGGLWSLLGYFRLIGRKEDFSVVIPNGSKEPDAIISKFVECYHDSIPFELKLLRVDNGEILQIRGFKIRAYSMTHRGSTRLGLGDLIPAFGYSVEYQGQRIAISGDTAYCKNLENLVEGAEFALIEATWVESPHGHDEVHLTVEEALEVGKLAKSFKIIHMTKKSEALLNSMQKSLAGAFPKLEKLSEKDETEFDKF